MAKKSKTNGHGGVGHNRGVLRLYRSYNHVTKNPSIDKLRTAMQDEGLDIKKLHVLSNVGHTTIDNWFNGKTKNPNSVTLNAAAAAMGFDWQLKREKKLDYAKEIPAAVRWHERIETDRNQQKK
jgi:transcriptional regulator with XRE-family HTH domain